MTTLFNQPLNVINVGIAMFSDDLKKQHVPVTQLDWTPPGQGNMQVVDALDQLAEKTLADKIAAANKIALERIIQSHPVLVGYDQAINVVPGMTRTTILHAGPPVAWENMCGAMKGAVTGALVFEGLAKDIEDAERVAASGEITFSPCHEHDCVGSMAGVTSASMFMHIVENKTYGNRAFTNLSEQMAKILRMGANDQSVIDRLNWMRDVLGPMLRDAMKIIGEIDLRLMLAQALHMGDECHNRNNAGTTLLIQALTPGLIQAGYPVEQQREVFEFVASSDYFSGPTWMAMCKAALDAAHGIEYSTVVTTMARNGYEFGLRIPEDVSIIGYDDIGPSGWASYALTSASQPVEAMVAATVDLLLKQIDSGTIEPEQVIVPGRLVVRHSARRPHRGTIDAEGNYVFQTQEDK